LIDKLESHVEEKDRDALRRLLSDLQINYTKLSLEKQEQSTAVKKS
jgi:hypothetical protein